MNITFCHATLCSTYCVVLTLMINETEVFAIIKLKIKLYETA